MPPLAVLPKLPVIAAVLFVLWFVQFAFSPIPPRNDWIGWISMRIHRWVTSAYFVWAAVEVGRIVFGTRNVRAFQLFAGIWRKYVVKG